MAIHIILIILTLAFVCPAALLAQETPLSAVDFCENNPGFSDWDFWLGDWEVYSNDEARTPYGKNSVTKHYENCLIKETWESAGGGGFSVNFFNPVKKEWRQVWVANGYSIDYTGGLNEQGQMVLEGEIFNYQPGTRSPFHGSWTPEENGDVIQRFEVFNSETGAWDLWFEGRYVEH
jgi:hypothetical protein